MEDILKEGIIDYTKNLLYCIIITCLLLCVCITVDYADDETITNINESTLEINTSNVIIINDSTYIPNDKYPSVIEGKSSDKIYTIKEKTTKINKYPKITVKGYPTCYTCWKSVKYHKGKTSYINYCPNCKRYNTLLDNPKHVMDGEITCSKCDCDFCCYCGRDKCGSSGRHNWNILKKNMKKKEE